MKYFQGVATKHLPDYLGWRRVFEQYHQFAPEMLSNAALRKFSIVTGDVALKYDR